MGGRLARAQSSWQPPQTCMVSSHARWAGYRSPSDYCRRVIGHQTCLSARQNCHTQHQGDRKSRPGLSEASRHSLSADC
eukprot:5714029-Pleurochrysis_carterae.AAC.1